MYQQRIASFIAVTVLVVAAPAAHGQATHDHAAAQAAPAVTASAAMPAASTQKPAAKPAPGKPRLIEMIGTDDMKFDVTNIDAKPGEVLRVRLTTKSAMPKIAMAHNFVLLKKDAALIKFITASAIARESDFIAPEMKDQIIAATGLAGGGETVEVTFKVPAETGQYPYVCTFPGHFQAGMRGTLTVK
jgi:azurin